jgi:hypothetical protein
MHVTRRAPPTISRRRQKIVELLVKVVGIGELNARGKRILPNHSIRVFRKGVATLVQPGGKEMSLVLAVLIGLINGFEPGRQITPGRELRSNIVQRKVIRATRAIAEFTHLAEFRLRADDTLNDLQTCLTEFHDYKDTFVLLILDLCSDFDIPKVHS